MALAGGGIRGGHVIGETDPAGGQKRPTDRDAQKIEDVHATVLHALGIKYGWEYISLRQPADQALPGRADPRAADERVAP